VIYKDVCNPITAEFREELYTNILDAYARIKEGEKDKPLQRVEEEALQREPQDIVEYLREQGVCLRQLARKLEQNETIFL
jgi:hypothetical protein